MVYRPCREPGCPGYALGSTGYCTAHQSLIEKKRRGKSAEYQHLYNAAAWRKGSKLFLLAHPLCAQCEAEGHVEAAVVVDHIEPHRGDQTLFFNRSNWQPLCKRHHDQKTAREDGGFGRPQPPVAAIGGRGVSISTTLGVTALRDSGTNGRETHRGGGAFFRVLTSSAEVGGFIPGGKAEKE